VDDGSTDATGELLAATRFGGILRPLRRENGGAPAARNTGAAAAAAPACLFLDDDILAEPELVAEHASLHRDRSGIVGIGFLRFAPEHDDPFSAFLEHWWTRHYRHLEQDADRPTFRDCFGGNMSVPTQAVRDIGGFATDLPAWFDIEFAYRLGRHGLRFAYLPRAAGTQVYENDARTILAVAARTGTAEAELLRRHPELAGLETPVQPGALRLDRVLGTLRPPPGLVLLAGRLVPRRWWRAYGGAALRYCRERGRRRAAAARAGEAPEGGRPGTVEA